MTAAIKAVNRTALPFFEPQMNTVCHELHFRTESSVKSFMELSQGLNHIWNQSKKVSLLVDTAKAGFGKTRKEIKGLVEKVAREKGVLKKQRVSDGWF